MADAGISVFAVQNVAYMHIVYIQKRLNMENLDEFNARLRRCGLIDDYNRAYKRMEETGLHPGNVARILYIQYSSEDCFIEQLKLATEVK